MRADHLRLRALLRVAAEQLVVDHVRVGLHDAGGGVDRVERLQIGIGHHAQDALGRDGLGGRRRRQGGGGQHQGAGGATENEGGLRVTPAVRGARYWTVRSRMRTRPHGALALPPGAVAGIGHRHRGAHP
jgi:hypothetical protein